MYARCYDMDNREIIKIFLSGGDILILGDNGLNQIKYHNPTGEGDKLYCDCYYEDGTAIRVFDVVHMYEELIKFLRLVGFHDTTISKIQ